MNIQESLPRDKWQNDVRFQKKSLRRQRKTRHPSQVNRKLGHVCNGGEGLGSWVFWHVHPTESPTDPLTHATPPNLKSCDVTGVENNGKRISLEMLFVHRISVSRFRI